MAEDGKNWNGLEMTILKSFAIFSNYSQTPIKRPPIKRPPPIRRPVIKEPKVLSVYYCKQNLYLAATSIKRPRPPFRSPEKASPIVFTPI